MKSPFLKYLFIFFMFLYPFSMHAQGNIKSKKSSRNPPLKFIESIVLATSASQKINEEEKTSILINKQEEIKNDQVDAIENLASIQFRYAQILDVAVEEMVNIYLYQFVDDWLNIHYKFGGTSKEGIDCSGFSSVLYNSIFSIQLPRTARDQYEICDKIEQDKLFEGDLVFFNTRGGISHVGVYLKNGFFVHSSSGDGVKISNLSEKYYHKRFIKGGRIISIDNAN